MSDKPRKKEEIPGIGIAFFFGLLGVVLPFVPAYFEWTARGASITAFMLSGVCLFIGLVGAAIELRSLGFFEGDSWENIGIGIALGVVGVLFHFISTWIPVTWLSIVTKVVVLLFVVLMLMFFGVALGQMLVEQRKKRDSGQEDRSSRTKATGAFVAFLLALITGLIGLATSVLEYLSAAK